MPVSEELSRRSFMQASAAGLSLTPRYYRPDKPTANDRPRIIGYTASNEVTARVHDLGKLGDLLDKVTLAGPLRPGRSARQTRRPEDNSHSETRPLLVPTASERASQINSRAGERRV